MVEPALLSSGCGLPALTCENVLVGQVCRLPKRESRAEKEGRKAGNHQAGDLRLGAAESHGRLKPPEIKPTWLEASLLHKCKLETRWLCSAMQSEAKGLREATAVRQNALFQDRSGEPLVWGDYLEGSGGRRNKGPDR